MSQSNADIQRLFDGYKSAVYAKDTAAFVALYDHDVSVYDLWERWSYDGIDAWRAMAESWFSGLGDERVVVTFDDVTIKLNGDLAIAHAIVTFTAISAQGATLRALNNRLTWALIHAADAWKIIHEHTSAPVAFGTMKAMLTRAPSCA